MTSTIEFLPRDYAVDLTNPEYGFIDNDDFLCTYPSNVQAWLSEEQWENLSELLMLSGELEENEDFDFCEWLSDEMGKDSITAGELRDWIDQQTEDYL